MIADRATALRPQCGTYAGAIAHQSHGERSCQPCREARNEYMRQHRRDHPDVYQRAVTRQKVRNRALRLLARKYAAEVEWLCQQIEKGRI